MNATAAGAEDADELGTRWPDTMSPAGIEHVVRRFSGEKSQLRRLPEAGELVLWRFRTEWQFVSAMDGGNWLSPTERKRLKTYRNSAVSKRFGVARTVLRKLLAAMFACEPADVRIEETPDERLRVRNETGGRAVHIDLAFAGIWIVIAASAHGVGLALSTPGAGDESGTLPRPAAGRARALSRARASESPAAPHAHTLDFPMPGEIAGAVTVAALVRRVTAFGWTH